MLAPIVSITEFNKLNIPKDEIVVTSGGFDPIHPGHISSIIDSKRFGTVLAVIVNGDWFLTNKKGKPFQDLETRCMIVAGIREVDYVIPFEIENDTTVSKALEEIKPGTFTKGGDRDKPENIAEWNTCYTNNIIVEMGVGLDKEWSSSDFLKDWEDFLKVERCII